MTFVLPKLLSRLAGLCLGVASCAPALRGDEAPKTFAFEDYYLTPLRIHLLSSSEQPDLHTTLSEADIERILSKVNRVWSQAGVCFYVESLVREEAAAPQSGETIPQRSLGLLLAHIPAEGYRADLFNVYYAKAFGVNGVYFPKAIFVKDTASLRPVEGGIDEPIPRVTSHELGHALGLAHRQDTFNLMASGTTGTSLNAAEVETVRSRAAATAERFEPASAMLAKADALLAEGKAAEARLLYTRLAALPLDGEPLTRIRQSCGASASDRRTEAR